MNNEVIIDGVYKLTMEKYSVVSSLIIIKIYEFNNMIYTLKLSPSLLSSILTTCSYLNGTTKFDSVLGDEIIVSSESEDIISLKINRLINLRLSKNNLEDIFDIFVNIISN